MPKGTTDCGVAVGVGVELGVGVGLDVGVTPTEGVVCAVADGWDVLAAVVRLGVEFVPIVPLPSCSPTNIPPTISTRARNIATVRSKNCDRFAPRVS